MSDLPWLEGVEGEVRLRLLVSPRASRTAFTGLRDDRLGLRVAAPPVEGAANAAVVGFVAGLLGVGKGSVRLVNGARGKRKVVGVSGVAAEDVVAAVLAELGDG